jgi:hypothetical protein
MKEAAKLSGLGFAVGFGTFGQWRRLVRYVQDAVAFSLLGQPKVGVG